MNVRQLEIFRAVVAFGGVANAATNLGISQPAISRMIKHTEEKLGFQLFKRMGRRLYPTDEAQWLYEEIDPLFASISSVQDRIDDIRASRARCGP
jgi:DNA-binding transcriptional LysR family regulator